MNRQEVMKKIVDMAENRENGFIVISGDAAFSEDELLKVIGFIVDNLDECKK